MFNVNATIYILEKNRNNINISFKIQNKNERDINGNSKAKVWAQPIVEKIVVICQRAYAIDFRYKYSRILKMGFSCKRRSQKVKWWFQTHGLGSPWYFPIVFSNGNWKVK